MSAPRPDLARGGERPRLPPLFFVASSIATLAAAAGCAGLFVPGVVPALADPTVAWSCLGVGLLLEFWAVSMAIGAARSRGDPGRG